MFRRFLPVFWACTLLCLMMQAPAQAATYAVAPFKVAGPQGYSYLGQAIPSMLNSRLFLQGQFEPVSRQDAVLGEKAPASLEAASALSKKYSADYVVWGNVTVMGDNASLDVSALSPDGKVWKQAVNSPVNALIGGMQNVADSINIEVFKRTDVVRASAAPAKGPARMNSAFVVNETHARSVGESYMNPSLRYQGTSDNLSQVRSQMLPFESYGFEVADINGDGRSEILILSKNTLFAYVWEGGNRLTQLAEYGLPSAVTPVMVRVYKDGKQAYVILSCQDEEERSAYSIILQMVDGKFKVLIDHIHRYLNVAKVPPLFTEVLIGQDYDKGKLTSGPVYEMRIEGNRLKRGGNLSGLPRKANLFNFSWMPADKGKRGDHVAMLGETEVLNVYDAKGKLLSATDDVFGGSSIAVLGDRGIGGLGVDEEDYIYHYVPMRMPVVDLDRDGRYELLANKPITTAGKLFTNYRTYPQGEIHAMLWDGMGLDLLWKTRRIKGTVCDLTVADANNNGTVDLVVCVNSYAGLASGAKTRSAVYLYPLDTTQVQARPNYQE